jgi:hypothetical protein
MTVNVTKLPVCKIHQSAGDMLREQAQLADENPDQFATCIVLRARPGMLCDWAVFGDTTCTQVIGFIEVAKHEMLKEMT